MQATGLTIRCTSLDCPPPSPREPSTPRTPRSPLAVSCSSSAPRISRRCWGAASPRAVLSAEPTVPASPRTAPSSSSPGPSCGPEQQQSAPVPHAATKPMYDCVDVATQSLAVSLTLDEYKQTLLTSSNLQQQLSSTSAGTAALPSGAAATAAITSLTHLTLTSVDLDSMGLCTHCRYPCYLSGMPVCEASHYLQMWDADASLKPHGFDAQATLRLQGVADIAAVSSGGRANGRWKPDNQDAFLVQPTASGNQPASSTAGAGSEPPAAAAIGVFDGHGRLGASAAAIVRQAMADRLAALQPEEAEAAAMGGLQGIAGLLDGCFTAAEAAMQDSGRDFSKSGCTAVLALLDRQSVSVAWAGDSRAVLGVCDAFPSMLGSLALSSGDLPPTSHPAAASNAGASSASMLSAGAGASTSYNGIPIHGMCAAVPLTEDHKPDRPVERERIAAAGGRVTRLTTDRFGNPAGPYRVFVPSCWSPGLALSRAFGDTLASSVGVTAKPEVTVLPLPAPHAATSAATMAAAGISNSSGASYCSSDGGATAACGGSQRHVLIVASDGLWEWISNTTAVGIASGATNAEDAAHALVEAAQKQWAVRYRGRNCDDITVVVAFLDR